MHLLIQRTRIGAAMRAVGWNQKPRSLGGVNARVVILITAFLAGATSGLAGVLGGITTANIVSFSWARACCSRGSPRSSWAASTTCAARHRRRRARRARGVCRAVPVLGLSRRHHLRVCCWASCCCGRAGCSAAAASCGPERMQALLDFWAAYRSTVAFAMVNSFFALSTYAVLSAGILSFTTVSSRRSAASSAARMVADDGHSIPIAGLAGARLAAWQRRWPSGAADLPAARNPLDGAGQPGAGPDHPGRRHQRAGRHGGRERQ